MPTVCKIAVCVILRKLMSQHFYNLDLSYLTFYNRCQPENISRLKRNNLLALRKTFFFCAGDINNFQVLTDFFCEYQISLSLMESLLIQRRNSQKMKSTTFLMTNPFINPNATFKGHEIFFSFLNFSFCSLVTPSSLK